MSTVKRIKLSDFESTLKDELKNLNTEMGLVIEVETKRVAKEAVQKLKDTSPVRQTKHGGRYAASWTYRKSQLDSVGNMTSVYQVYNRKHYRLTHLLEFGHIIHQTGERTREFPHIYPVNKWIEEELPERIKKGVEK